MIGRTIGNYRIIEKIGEGGMGTVFKGFDTMLQREVAIKMLRPDLANQQKVVERFHTEAIALAKLNHSNIATVYNFLNQDDDYFMVMEYVPGDTLARIIKSHGAVTIERATSLFLQALDAVAHAHEMGVIHRDIKPANILLSESGVLKLTDFGIARVIGTARITRRGSVVGTIEYMSPEQILGEEGDERSDIYSMGILLYEMLLGRVPFESDSEFELMKSQVEQLPPPPRTVSDHIPLQLEEVIMRSLAKKSEARFQTALEFRAALENSMRPVTVPLDEALAGESPCPLYAAPATRIDENLIAAFAEPQPESTIRLGSCLSEIRSATTLPDFEPQKSETRLDGSEDSREALSYPLKSSGETKLAGTINPTPVYDEASTSKGRVIKADEGIADTEVDEMEVIVVSSPTTLQQSLFKMRDWKYYAALILFLIIMLSWVAFNKGLRASDDAQAEEVITPSMNQSVIPSSVSAPGHIQNPPIDQTDSTAATDEADDKGSSSNINSTHARTEADKKPAAAGVRRREGRVGKIFKKIIRFGQ